MKKLVIIAVLAVVSSGIVFAQTARKEFDKVTIDGALAFMQGRVAVQGADDSVYFTGRDLDKLVGFVDGFKEGAPVQIEGYVFAPPTGASFGDNVKFVRTLKVTFNGKDYEMRAGFQNDNYYGKTNPRDFHRDGTFSHNRRGFDYRHNKWGGHRFPR
ncbi:MAG: hypothetical protein LBI40_01670 [Treponema sp.]|jgi:hypothetical protein|nr:hypothetical protein [Treponema sp.]